MRSAKSYLVARLYKVNMTENGLSDRQGVCVFYSLGEPAPLCETIMRVWVV